jgi:hypothetical protein
MMWVITTEHYLVNVKDARSIYAEYEGSGGATVRIIARYPEGTTALLATVHGKDDLRERVNECLQTLLTPVRHVDGVCNLPAILALSPPNLSLKNDLALW